MSNFSDLFGGGIRSIQRGVATPTELGELVITVTAVNTAKSMLNLLSGCSFADSGYNTTTTVSLRLISATTIGITSQSLPGSGTIKYLPCSWELIEFA